MKHTIQIAHTAALTLALAGQLSAQTPGPQIHSGLPRTHIVVPSVHVAGGELNAAQNTRNPPAAVRQPGNRTRLIVALAFVGACAVLGIALRDNR